MLVIVRHGNTFNEGEELRRVGARTDLPLSASGRAQAEKLEAALKEFQPAIIYTSVLKRTKETALLALPQLPQEVLEFLNEVDYGPDENKPESEVRARLGDKALEDWEERNIVPSGWIVNKEDIIEGWQMLSVYAKEKNSVVVTSNGIARFAPQALGVTMQGSAKMKTGAYSVFTFENGAWALKEWSKRP